MAIINASNSQAFAQWFDFYADKFTRISDSALVGYWYLYGRDSKACTASPYRLCASTEPASAR